MESINSLALNLLYGLTLTSVQKNITLNIQTFVGEVMSLLFNVLSRFVIAFLPRSKSFNLMAIVTVHSDFGAQEETTYL